MESEFRACGRRLSTEVFPRGTFPPECSTWNTLRVSVGSRYVPSVPCGTLFDLVRVSALAEELAARNVPRGTLCSRPGGNIEDPIRIASSSHFCDSICVNMIPIICKLGLGLGCYPTCHHAGACLFSRLITPPRSVHLWSIFYSSFHFNT